MCPNQDAFRDHNGIINKHTERNDERAQRDSVHWDAHQVHGGQSCRDGKNQDGPNHERRFEPHEDHKRHQYDRERQKDVQRKLTNRLIHNLALMIRLSDLDPIGTFDNRLGQLLLDRLAYRDNITA